MTFAFLSVTVVNRVIKRVGVGAVIVTFGPFSLPDSMVTAGGVIVAVVSIVTAIVAVEVTETVLVTLSYKSANRRKVEVRGVLT